MLPKYIYNLGGQELNPWCTSSFLLDAHVMMLRVTVRPSERINSLRNLGRFLHAWKYPKRGVLTIRLVLKKRWSWSEQAFSGMREILCQLCVWCYLGAYDFALVKKANLFWPCFHISRHLVRLGTWGCILGDREPYLVVGVDLGVLLSPSAFRML